MRLCDNCQVKMSPYVPRKRVGDQFLCPACVASPRGGYVSAALKNANTSWPPPGMQSDDHDGVVTYMGYHPLAAPLPPVVWNNYHKRRALLGQDPFPQRVYDQASGRIKRSTRTRDELLAAFKARSDQHTGSKTAADLAPGDIYPKQGLIHQHPDQMSYPEMAHHLMATHGYGGDSVTNWTNSGTLKAQHDISHALTNYGNSPGHHGNNPVESGNGKHHAHEDFEDFSTGHEAPASVAMKPQHQMNHQELEDHLVGAHGHDKGVLASMGEDYKHDNPLANPTDHLKHVHETNHESEEHNQGNGNFAIPHTHESSTSSSSPVYQSEQSFPGLHGKMSDDQLKEHLNGPHGYPSTHGDSHYSHVHVHEDLHETQPGVTHTHDDHGYVVSLAGSDDGVQQHPEDMGQHKLKKHLLQHHGSDTQIIQSHEDTLAQHAKEHEEGKNSYGKTFAEGYGIDHVHKNKDLTLGSQTTGKEGEWLGSPTLPATTSKHDAITHLVKHHPEVDEDDYQKSPFSNTGTGGIKAWHESLHSKEAIKNGTSAQDEHTHLDPPSIHDADIPIGVHLTTHHGMSHEDVSKMKPAEFEAHHEKIHQDGDDVAIGHSHAHPGGPVTPAKKYLANPEYPNTDHSDEWHHSAGRQFEGPPLNSTENQRQNGTWGRHGENDWNCHLGAHFTSLHEMAEDFGSGSRVIHAKLKMTNPKVYDSLNHLAHDSYDRLVKAGEIDDDNHGYVNNHTHSGSNAGHCCSDALLEYAKNSRDDRDDGKYGLQKVRDSLRAEGHDGVMVRNHVDSPTGHWNAIPFSQHDIEMTDPSCNTSHGDERDHDKRNYRAPADWHAPNGHAEPSNPDLPDADAVRKAGEKETERRRGDLGGNHPDPDYHGSPGDDNERYGDEDEDEEPYCSHCDSSTHDTDDDDAHEYCSVCEEYGHEEETHPFCSHCDEHATHDSSEHEDEHGEHPDSYKPQDYCPACGNKDKDNRESSTCNNCGEKLPDWSKVIAHGKALSSHTPSLLPDKQALYTPEDDKKGYTDSHYDTRLLHDHLTKEHASDLSGEHFKDSDGEPSHAAMDAHHNWLHFNQDQAKKEGFPEFEHKHPHQPDYVPEKSMKSAELKLHMQADHHSKNEVDGLDTKALRNLHAAQHQEGGPEHDYEDHYVHSHNLNPKDHVPANHPASTPTKKNDITDHLKTHHGLTKPTPPDANDDTSAYWGAVHEKMHAHPNTIKHMGDETPDHAHTAHGIDWTGESNEHQKTNYTGVKTGYKDQAQWEATKAMNAHLIKSHGMGPATAKQATKGGYAHAIKNHIIDHATNPAATAHNHHVPFDPYSKGKKSSLQVQASNGYGAMEDYLQNVKGHLSKDHGVANLDTDHSMFANSVDPMKAMHEFHANLHGEMASGAQHMPAGAQDHDHESGHQDAVVPASLKPDETRPEGQGKWTTPDITSHLKKQHGYTPPPLAGDYTLGPGDLNALHQHWHNHPEHAVEHGLDIDHFHTHNGNHIDPDKPVPFVSQESTYDLKNHLISHHHDISDQHKDLATYPYSDQEAGAKKMQEIHQHAHSLDEGMGTSHTHMPDPNKPVIDDPSINDVLAKHLVGSHAWTKGSFGGKTNQDLIDRHMNSHHSLDPMLIQAGTPHGHDVEEYAKFNKVDGKTAEPPTDFGSIGGVSEHLQTHHGKDISNLPHDTDAIHDLHAKSHQDLDNKGHALDHTHPWGLKVSDETASFAENTAKAKLLGHIKGFHGYKGHSGVLGQHPDLEGLHANLHENPDLHNAPAFGGKDLSPTWHHHTDETGLNPNFLKYNSAEDKMSAPKNAPWEDELLASQEPKPPTQQGSHQLLMNHPTILHNHLHFDHPEQPWSGSSAADGPDHQEMHENHPDLVDHTHPETTASDPKMTGDQPESEHEEYVHTDHMSPTGKMKHLKDAHGFGLLTAKSTVMDGDFDHVHQHEHLYPAGHFHKEINDHLSVLDVTSFFQEALP